MATQAIFPPPQWWIQDLSHKKVVKIGWFRQTRKLAVGSKPADVPHVDSHVTCANQPNFRQFLDEGFLQETFLTK
jgi:hypothetical protein